MSMLLIMNPGSRAGRNRALHDYWLSRLRERRVSFEVVRTARAGDARAAARTSAGFDPVVAVGGDGTINEVVDGVMLSRRQDARLGVLYAGTSPDLCRFHGIPVRPEPALDALLSGRSAPIDVVQLTYSAAAAAGRTAHFVCSCNVGLGAAVARVSNRLRPWLGDRAGTGLALLAAVLRQRPVDLTLEVDGAPVALPAVNHLMILKNPFVASGLKLALPLRPDDGMIELFAVQGRSAAGLLRLIPAFYSGAAVRRSDCFRRRCRRAAVRSAAALQIEFDGDPQANLPIEVQVLPRAVSLLGGAS